MRILFFCFLSALFFALPQMNAQDQLFTKERVTQELENRGLDAQEFYYRMEERGIYIDQMDINNMTLSDRVRLQSIAQEVLKELTDEKRQEEKEEELRKLNELDSLGEEILLEEEEPIMEKDSIILSEKFGQRLFQQQIRFIDGEAGGAPSGIYILGPGDVINISTWGESVYDASYEIDENGFIHPYIDGRNLPQLSVGGLTVNQMRNLVKDRFARFLRFKEGQYAITVNRAREISVSIYGEVNAPGTYGMSASNNVFTAIAKAGGPRESGTLRDIKLIRGENEQTIDFYDFVFSSMRFSSLGLQDKDVIYVSRATSEVKVKGAARDTFIFDLVETDRLEDVIGYAGGLKGNGDPTNIQIKRFLNGQKKLVDVNFLTPTGRGTALVNGDTIFVRTVVEETLFDYVRAEGAFYYPSQYELNGQTKVSEILQKARLREDYTPRGAHIRRSNLDSTYSFIPVDLESITKDASSSENVVLIPGDELYVFSKSSFAEKQYVIISGEVQDSIGVPYDPSGQMTVYDMISMAGGLTSDAYETGYVLRHDDNSNERTYIPINVRAIENNYEYPDNISLRGRDSIVVLNRRNYEYDFTISIMGEVNNPGEYVYSKNVTIRDLINLAGGLKLEAARNRVEINRVTLMDNQASILSTAIVEIDEDYNPINGEKIEIKPFDNVVIRTLPEFSLQKYVQVQGEVVYPGPYVITKKNERIFDLVKRAGGLTPEAFEQGASLYRLQDSLGFVVIELEEIMKNENSHENITLKEGDILSIPKTNEVVTIQGAINLSDAYADSLFLEGDRKDIHVAYQPGKSVRYYIESKGGGYKDNADPRNISVTYADGSVGRTSNFLFFRTYPRVERGSTINVGYKSAEKAKDEEKEPVDWGQLVANTISQATAVLTLILLIERATD